MPRGWVEELDELLVEDVDLGPCVSPVLLENACQGPLVELAKTSNNASRAMCSFGAMDEQRTVGGRLEDLSQSFG